MPSFRLSVLTYLIVYETPTQRQVALFNQNGRYAVNPQDIGALFLATTYDS